MKTNSLKLTSSEIGGVWAAFMNDSMALCTLGHFLRIVEDKEIHNVLQFAYNLSEKHIKLLRKFLKEDGLAIPQGFTSEDVDLKAPRLYSDNFYLFYLINMAKFGMSSYSVSLFHVSREDIRHYFSECLVSSVELYNKLAETMLSKGLFIKAPRVEVTKEIDFIKKDSFLSGFIRELRPLLTIEITHIFANALTSIVGRPLVTGFAQAAKSRQVRDYMLRGKDISSKHIEVLSSLLANEDIPIPSTYETFTTDSTIAPFSDKLMMFHIALLNSSSIGAYAAAMAASMRRDLHANYVRLSAEIAQYANDGINIMIDNGWMEQPPQVINHEVLAGV
ncbi:MAG: DUF3231 family protein [Bacillota bacterium]